MSLMAVQRTSLVSQERNPSRDADRERWDRHFEFILSLLGYCIGFGNVWRFPYRAYKNGGSAFLLPYAFLMFVVGKPMFFMESGFGQFSSLGPISSFDVVPVCRGLGIGMVILCAYFCIYYIMLLVYITKFLYYSCHDPLPWESCQAWWGATDEICYVRKAMNESLDCDGVHKDSPDCIKEITPVAETFWKIVILHEKDDSSIENLGEMYPEMVLLLLLNWIIIYVCLIKGIRSSGKVVYFTAIFPYVALVAMGIYVCTLPGAMTGLHYLFWPDFDKLFTKDVWTAAINQMFYSLGIGLGPIIIYSSYNEFSNKIKRDVVVIALMDFFTSILASVVIFSTLGFMAKKLNRPVASVVAQGPGLMFYVIPEALVMLPLPQLWSVIFFLMLFTLGVDSQFVMVETILTSLRDEVKFVKRHRAITSGVACFVLFLLGLPFCTSGGFYVFDLYDGHAVQYGILFVALGMTVVISFVYGYRRFVDDLHFMLGKRPTFWYWQLCWIAIDPLVMLIMLIMTFMEVNNADYNGRPFPLWLLPIKSFMAILPLIAIPISAVWAMIEYRMKTGSVRQAFKVKEDWGPRDPLTRAQYVEWKIVMEKKRKEAGTEKIFVVRTVERLLKKIRRSPSAAAQPPPESN